MKKNGVLEMKTKGIAVLSATVVAGVGLGVSNGTEVLADTTDEQTSTPVTTEQVAKETPEKAVQTADNKVTATQEQVDAAKKTADSSQQVAQKAQDNVDAAQKKIDETQKVVDAAKETVKEATPEAIDAAKQAVDEQQVANEKTEAQLPKDTQVVNEAVAAETAAKDEVEAAKKEATDSGVDLNNTENLDSKNEQLTADLEKAKKAEEQAANNIQSSQEAKDSAKSKVDEATASSSKADQTAKEAENAANDAKAKVEATKEKIAQAQSAIGNQNVITIGQDYVDALNAFNEAGEKGEDLAKVAETIDNIGEKYQKMNKYVPDSADEKVIIKNRSEFTTEVQRDLSIFVAGLANPLREMFGVNDLAVSDDSVKFAVDVANNYVKNNWGFTKAHDMSSLKAAFLDYREKADNNGIGDSYGENLAMNWVNGFNNHDEWNLSLANIKESVYESMIMWLFADGGPNGGVHFWGHANNILSRTWKTDDEYVGLSIEIDPNVPDADNGIGKEIMEMYHMAGVRVHFLRLSKYKDNTNTSKVYDIPKNDSTEKQAELAKLSEELQEQTAEATTLNEKMVTAKDKQKQAENLLVVAKHTLETANSDNQQAKADLEKARKTVDDTQKALATLKNQREKVATLKDKQQALATAQNAVKKAKAQLAETQKMVEDGKTELTDKQAYLESLQKAEKNLDYAEARHLDAQIEYWWALKALTQAKDTASTDQATYEKLKAQLVSAKDSLNEAQNKQIIEEAIKKVESKPNTTKLVTKVTTAKVNKSAAPVKLATSAPTKIKTSSALAYPQTGSTEDHQKTMLGAVILSMLGTLGLVSIGKHDRRFGKR